MKLLDRAIIGSAVIVSFLIAVGIPAGIETKTLSRPFWVVEPFAIYVLFLSIQLYRRLNK